MPPFKFSVAKGISGAVAVGIVVAACSAHDTPSAPAQPSPSDIYSPQVALPFSTLANPTGVAVDAAGDLYVTDSRSSRVLKLAAGSSSPTVLPFTGLNHPTGVAVDAAGDLYVADAGNTRVLRLAAGSTASRVLAFSGLKDPEGVAVDTAGTCTSPRPVTTGC